MPPSVAVVVPVHGAVPYLEDALESVEGVDEVLVVEDGESDAVEPSNRHGATLVRLPRVGRSRARNAGVEAASAPFVAFLDSDDLALPGRFERQRATLGRASSAAMCAGRVQVVDARLEPEDDWNALLRARFDRLAAEGATYEALLESRCPIYTSATMVRREAFLRAGGYDARFDAYEDLDLYLRLSRRGGLTLTGSEPVSLYRLHGANTDSDRLYLGMLGVVDKHLPEASGRARRLLLERRVEALWGLREFGDAASAARKAAREEPALLLSPIFLKRLARAHGPRRILERLSR